MAKPHYRAGVVAVVRRSDGHVLAFERADIVGAWQLPQGGIEPGESAHDAVWRELAEETGLGPADVRLVAEHPELTAYEWPTAMRDSDRLGQVHRWFFFEPEDEASLVPTPDGSEFRSWSWMPVVELLEHVVDFRKAPYRRVLGG